MEKKFLFLRFLLIVLSVNSFSQSYLNINWDDKTGDLKTSNHDLQGIFSNHYVEYFNSKFSDEVYIYETHHMKTKINKITDDSNNDIFISKINVSEIVDVKSKIINDDTTATYGFEEMKKMIDKSTSSENYNYYKIPGIKEQDIVEVIYTVKRDFNFNGNKIIEESYPILSSKFILIENDFKSNIKIYNSFNSFVEDTLIDGKKSKIINFKNLDATSNEQYSTPIANKIKVSYQCYENREDVSQTEYWNNLVQNLRELFFPSSINPIAIDLFNEIQKNNISIPKNEISISNKIDEYIKNNFIISDDDDPNLNEISYIFDNKISNDFSIIQVYTNLLKAAKVDYEVAISCNRYFLKFDPELFDPNQLREFVIYLPKSEKYISPNRIEYRVSEAPDDLLGNYGVFIDKNLDYYFSEITQSDKNFSEIKKKIEIYIPKNLKKLKIKENRSFSGYWAIMNRNYVSLSENEETDFLIDYFTINGLNNKKVTNYNIKNFDISNNSYNNPLRINSTITTTELVEEVNGLVYLKVGKVIGLQSNLFDDNKRINEIEINFPNSYEYQIEVEIPKGYRVLDYSELNKAKEFISVDGSISAKFNSKATLNNNKINIVINEFYKNLRYDKGRYQEFREVINAAAKFYESTVILEQI
tara:strand:- start:1711 stop:3642 length:1932 start_codon:yes stop_codon:yes gene_type:complete